MKNMVSKQNLMSNCEPGVGARLEDFLNFLSWDPSLFDPSDPVQSLTYRVLVTACKEASLTLASTQTHSLAAHWRQQNGQHVDAHKAKRDKQQQGAEEGEQAEKTGMRGVGVSSPPTDCTGESGDARRMPGARPPPPPPPPPMAAIKPRPGLIPA